MMSCTFFLFHVTIIHFVYLCEVLEVSAEAYCLLLVGQPRIAIMSWNVPIAWGHGADVRLRQHLKPQGLKFL